MSDVFLAYHKQDSIDAERLYRALHQKGWDVWWARDLKPGQHQRKETEVQLKKAKVVIVIWSAHSVGADFIMDIAASAQSDKKLIPVVFDRNVERPMGFQLLESLDLSQWNGHGEAESFGHLQRTIADVRRGNWRILIENMDSTGLASDFFEKFLINSGGLPVGRLLVGAISFTLFIVAVSLISTIFDGLNNTLSVLVAMPFIFLATVFTRIMHQFVVIAKGQISRRFLDQDFSFSIFLSFLLALMAAGYFLIRNGDSTNIGQVMMFTIIVFFGLFVLTGVVRVLTTGLRIFFAQIQ